MEQAAQIDLLILVIVFLSVLVGYNRGLCAELLGLTIYVASGLLGYSLIPVFQPMFSSFIKHEGLTWFLSLSLGTFFAWIVLRGFFSFFVQKIQSGNFRRLDKSLGILFGFARGGAFVLLLSFFAGVFSKNLMDQSRLLQWSFPCVRLILKQFPEIRKSSDDQADNPKKDQEALLLAGQESDDPEIKNWQTRTIEYMLEKKVQTVDGERSLFSVMSEVIAAGMSADSSMTVPHQVVEPILLNQLGQKRELTEEEKAEIIRQINQQRRERNENLGNR